MSNGLAIGRFLGVEVRVHWSWLLVLGLLTAWLGGEMLPQAAPTLTPGQQWLTAALTAALVFLSVAAHELAHVAIARRNGVEGGAVTLHLLGGTYVIELKPATAKQELAIALAGPVVSVALAVAFGAIAIALPGGGGLVLMLSFATLFLCDFNAFLALINLIPGYPMDGGPIVRSIAWLGSRDQGRATAIAGRFGRYTGYLFVGAGAAVWLGTNDLWSGLVVALGGFLLSSGGRTIERREFVKALVRGLRVRDALAIDIPHVPPQLTLDTFAPEYLTTPGGVVLVERNGEVLGLVGTLQAQRAGRRNWPKLHAQQLLVPLAAIPAIDADSELWPALEQLERLRLDALVVSAAPDVDQPELDAAVTAEVTSGAGPATVPAVPGAAGAPDASQPAAGAGPSGEAIVADAAAEAPEPDGVERTHRRGPALVTRLSAAKRVHLRVEERLRQETAARRVGAVLGLRGRATIGRRGPSASPPPAHQDEERGPGGPAGEAPGGQDGDGSDDRAS